MRESAKVEILGQSAQYDICSSSGCSGAKSIANVHRTRGQFDQWIYPAALPNGGTVHLLKILMSNDCRNDCSYCVNRCSSQFRRTSFEADELAKLFASLRDRGIIGGLFLSSAVQTDADPTMEKMIAAVELVRRKYDFDGYVHLKVLPGASFDRIERAAQLANRISINMEAPSAERLAKLSAEKDFQNDLLLRMKWIGDLVKRDDTRAAGHTTQFVVGAADESDREILQTTDDLYKSTKLERAYFSAFQPVKDSPLEDLTPTPTIRQHRLYETDFLVRSYGFRLNDIVFTEDGNLPLDRDPKTAWAEAHPERFPIEINKAGRRDLMKIPGIGPTSATRIMEERINGNRCKSLSDLKSLGVVTKWAAPYVLINGRSPSDAEPTTARQLTIW